MPYNAPAGIKRHELGPKIIKLVEINQRYSSH